MTIRLRLVLLLAIPVLALVLLGVVAHLESIRIERQMLFTKTQLESLFTIGEVGRMVSNRQITLRNCIISKNPDECARSRESFTTASEGLRVLFRKYSDGLINDDEDSRIFREVRNLADEWNARAVGILGVLDAGKREQAEEQISSDFVLLGTKLSQLIEEWMAHNEQAGQDAGANLLHSLDRSRTILFTTGVLAIVIACVLGVFVVRSISKPLDRLRSSVETIAAGRFDDDVPGTDANNEIGRLARSILVLKDGAAEMEEQRWVKLNAARIAGVLQSAATVEDFGQSLASEMTPLLGGGICAVYAADGTADRITRVAAFGMAGAAAAAPTRFGEGLVGQCAAARTPSTLSDLPPDHLQIESGLGASPPRFAGAWPMLVHGAPIGIFEFASFRAPNARERRLIDEVLPVAAIGLDLLSRNLRTQELLVQTQRQSAALEAQQASLKASEEEFRTLLEAAPDALIITAEDGHILLVNAQAERLLGYRREELVGQLVEILVPERIRARHPGLRKQFHASASVRSMGQGMELTAVRKDGTEFPVEISLSPLQTRERGSCVCSSLRDITERKRAQDELRQAKQKAEEATVAKSAFLANMSHEIRTPMNGIMGMTELALDTELTAEQRDYLNTVKSSADALLSLINDILDFSKIEAGRIELDPVDFLLRDAVSDTLNPLSLRASSKGVELAYDVQPDVPDALIGDIYRLRQVVVNLVGNAIKFTERGEVVVSISVLERSGDDLLLKIAVRDTGIGISPEAAARLFKPFEQAESSTTRKYGGTGLGLAISRQLVELMGGTIRLESEHGKGSTFIFTSRFKVGVARETSSAEDAARVFTGKTALIVDDNETNRRILAGMLGHWGLRSACADSGLEALTLLDRSSNAGQPVAVLLTDLHMPEMDGFELVQTVRSRPTTAALPVLLLTSSASPGDNARATELGIAARLLKPVKQSLLLDNLMRVLSGASRLDRPQAPADAPAAPAGESRSLRILLAEDNAVNQKFAVRLLTGSGHQVTVAGNGREAVEKWTPQAFDVILMDVQMPEMDGLDATRAIRSRESGPRTPIIAMTANAMKGDREMCIDAGMDGYVPKPVRKELLYAEIERVLKEVRRG